MQKVAMVELSVFERIAPLVSGYLESYARTDDGLAREYQFEKYTTGVQTPADDIVRDLLAIDADVYGLSCYVWNMGLMRRVARAIRAGKPDAHMILGGPQAMHHAQTYLDPADELTAVCNGEGELTFSAYLRELAGGAPDLSRVEGISFARGGEIVTTEAQSRIKDLDGVPSPYLGNLFAPGYTTAVLETNRGCPYHCGFCYWGAATNDRVYRFDESRVRDEITWMSRNNVLFLFIADANWGMLGRDVELSEHLAAEARQHHMPRAVYFAAAKNKPQAVTKITRILHEAGLVVSQPVSMQSLEPRSLEIIARSNIKLDAFATVQQDLLENNINSYIELIWPLPGETLTSYQAGIDKLCAQDAHTIITYPHLLLNNTPIYRDREKLHLGTRPAHDGVAEAQIVISTEDVSEEEFADGMRFFYSVYALHNTRSLHTVSRYLAGAGIASYADVFSAFARHARESSAGGPITEFTETSIRDARYYDLGNYGLFAHTVLHEHRDRFSQLLREHVTAQPWWQDPLARGCFEIDLLNFPYIYSNTPFARPDYAFRSLRLLDVTTRGYLVELDEPLPDLLRGSVLLAEQAAAGTRIFAVEHRRMQHPYMQRQSLDHNAHYCHGMIEKVNNMSAMWRPVTR